MLWTRKTEKSMNDVDEHFWQSQGSASDRKPVFSASVSEWAQWGECGSRGRRRQLLASHAQATDVIRTAGSTETLLALWRSRLRPVLIKTRVVRRQVPQNCSPQLQNVN